MNFALAKKAVPISWKLRLREWVLTQYGIPFSRFDVPAPLVERFRGRGPITLVDVGASSGDFAANLDKFCGIKHALLVEPIPMRGEELKLRFRKPRFIVVTAAVGCEETTMDMEILNWDYSSSLLPVDRTDPNINGTLDLSVRDKIRTRVARLDDLCRENGFAYEIDLLKIDVQGVEHLVLSGAQSTLQKTNSIWIEVSFRPLYFGAERFERVYDICRASGFNLIAFLEGFRGKDGELLQGDALFLRRDQVCFAKREPGHLDGEER